ncbi:cellulose biosynthesis cyclic di-GMP-binding regulatory protein BcsB [Phytobacter palmae]|uniref:Cyclic di-GMP-binding protein n=1 Tax=Phytobacter palmae TaxID=1855371 RepID=A0ABU9V0W3_9ENTR
MKRLTTLAVLVGSLFMMPLHAEDTSIESLLKLNEPADTAPVPVPPPGAPVFIPSVVNSISLAQMGFPEGISLTGGQLQGGASFTLPVDQVITTARLELNLKISPAMVAKNATMQLMLNGQPLGTVPLTVTDSDTARYQLDIPSALMVSSNNLSFKINDGDAMQCQRDLSDKYRVTILADSHFELEGQQLDIGADLSHFPRPFFDSMQMTPAAIAMAFPAKLSPDALSASALISSWMGIQADYRGVSFAAYHDRLPEKNGILIGHPGEQIGGLTLPDTEQSLLKVVDNPANPVYKLLLVVGKDDASLRAAAWRLTRGNFAFQTPSVDVTSQTIPMSKPYDAPRWISTDRPVKLSELIRKDQSLTTTGLWHDPLRVAFRAAPDLFLWDGETIPLHIGYRFPTESWIDEDRSWLSMTMNDTFLHNLPVNKQGALETLWHKLGGDARQEKFDMPLEPYMIYGDNQLSLYFNIQPKANAPCSVLLNNNIKSRIEDDSWIDLSHTRHFALLPNLSYFVGASFPFTRLADYSETVLMLPQNPTETQIATLLDMAARSGNATGTALGHNRVVLGVPTGGAGAELLNDRDVLAVTGLDQHDFNRAILNSSPFVMHDSTLGVREPTTWERIKRWITGDWASDGLEADRYFSSNEAWRGFVSFPSPWNNDRLVVLAIGSNDDQLSRLHGDLASAKINAGIRGDAAVITNENGVRSFRVGEQFPSGEMPVQMRVIWYANQHSALLAILGLLFGCIVGSASYVLLRNRAKRRLDLDNRK